MRNKILSLFEYRKFPQLFEIVGENDNEFLEELIDLQLKIYYLDAHLESNWNLDQNVLASCWKDIYNTSLLSSLSKENKIKYCKKILKYQSHEVRLRKQKLPTDFKLEYFYFYKSCDVKLLRRLIYEKYPKLTKSFKITDWRWFDLITEINDDVEDIYEDLDFYNGNAFSIYIIKNGKEYTFKLFNDFIDYTIEKSSLTLSKNKNHQMVHDWTVENAQLTKELLKERINNINLDDLKSSLLFTEI
jgi:hypothetical protein